MLFAVRAGRKKKWKKWKGSSGALRGAAAIPSSRFLTTRRRRLGLNGLDDFVSLSKTWIRPNPQIRFDERV